MIPVKIQCGCGQKYAFEVEPVNGQMAATVACPVCGMDGTAAANQVLAQTLAGLPQPPPLPPRTAAAPIRPAARAVVPAPTQSAGKFNLALGILGAFLGALVGVGVMYGFYEWAGFRFPLLGVGIGVLTGFSAKWMSKGTGNTLGIISAVIATISVVGTLYLMYGTFPIISIISVIVSISVAYRIAAR